MLDDGEADLGLLVAARNTDATAWEEARDFGKVTAILILSFAADIREIYAEGKAAGFDVRIMRRVIRLRKMEKADRDEQETLLDLYLRAIGMDDGAGTAE